MGFYVNFSGGGAAPAGSDGDVQTRVNSTTLGGVSPGTNGNVLKSNGSAWVSGAAPAGSPAGSDTQVQFNDGGGFGADAGLTYAKSTDVLSVLGAIKLGSTTAAAGFVRVPYNAGAQSIVAMRDSGNSADWNLIKSTGGALEYGDATPTVTLRGYSLALVAGAGAAIDTAVNSQYAFQVTSSVINCAQPLAGEQRASIPFRFKRAAITKSDANDLTLSAAQYECVILAVSGTPGGNFSIIAPDTADAFFIVTNTTANTLTIKKSGGTGVTIASNNTAIVRHNATDYLRVTTDASTGGA
jgi:hypothetical protein